MKGWPAKGQKNKYGNQKVWLDGERFDSKLEAGHWCELKRRERAGEINGLERQVRMPLHAVTGQTVCHIVPDFAYLLPDGTRVFEDAKGMILPEWSLKAKWFEIEYGTKIVIVRKRG